MTSDLFSLHSLFSLLLDCSCTALPLGTLLTCQLGPVLYGANKCLTFEGEIGDFYLLSGLQILEELPFSAWCQQFCCCLSSQAWPTSPSSLQWLHSCRRQFFKMNISPLLLEFNCMGRAAGLCLELISPCLSWFRVKANCSCAVVDVHLFSKVKCPSTYRNGFFSRPFWSHYTLTIRTVFVAN